MAIEKRDGWWGEGNGVVDVWRKDGRPPFVLIFFLFSSPPVAPVPEKTKP